MAKVIQLTDNSIVTLLPITDSNYVQISYDGVTKSVADAILENEEVTAVALNDLDIRMQDVESSVSNINIATNSTVGLVKGGKTWASTMGVSIDSKGAMTVDHYAPTGSSKTVTTKPGNVSLEHGSSLVITGLSYSVDVNGHVTTLTATTGTLPADTKVAFTSTSDANKYPLIFKYSTGSTATEAAVRFDSVSSTAYYVASTHSAYINTTYHAASYLAGNEMVGFNTINSTMDTLSLFSSTGAPSTIGVMFRDRYNNVVLPVTSSDMIEVNYGGNSKILTSLLRENEQATSGVLNDLYSRIVELEDKVAKLEKKIK